MNIWVIRFKLRNGIGIKVNKKKSSKVVGRKKGTKAVRKKSFSAYLNTFVPIICIPLFSITNHLVMIV